MNINLAVIGPTEWGIILVVLLLLFGAKKLPELARGMGKSMGEFKRARQEFEDEITRGETEAMIDDDKPRSKDKTETSRESNES